MAKAPPTSETFQDFIEHVAQIRRDWHPKAPLRELEEESLWFRGQQCASWGLSPRLYRKQYKGAQEAEIRFQFQSRAIQLIPGRLPADRWEWYFLMQHHGCPTRLLDWTDNPLTGLFFALQEMTSECPIHRGRDCDRAIWVLDPWRLNARTFKGKGIDGPILSDWEEAQPYLLKLESAFDSNRNVDFRGRKLPAALDPPHVAPRIAVQGGHFVVFGAERDLSRIGFRWLKKLVVEARHVDPLRRELEQCKVNILSIFPDLDHLGGFIGTLAQILRAHR
jgi:hypothetical protein